MDKMWTCFDYQASLSLNEKEKTEMSVFPQVAVAVCDTKTHQKCQSRIGKFPPIRLKKWKACLRKNDW